MCYKQLATTDDVARRFGVTRNTVRKWVRLGIVPFMRASRRVVRFDLDEVERALANRQQDEHGD